MRALRAADFAAQVLGVRRAAVAVDVLAVRLGGDREQLCAQAAQHARRDAAPAAVRAVERDRETVELEPDRRIVDQVPQGTPSRTPGRRRRASCRPRPRGPGAGAPRCAAPCSSSSLSPLDEKILIPLSSAGLCEALTMAPSWNPCVRVSQARPGCRDQAGALHLEAGLRQTGCQRRLEVGSRASTVVAQQGTPAPASGVAVVPPSTLPTARPSAVTGCAAQPARRRRAHGCRPFRRFARHSPLVPRAQVPVGRAAA